MFEGAQAQARLLDRLRGRGGSLRARTEAAAVGLASSRWGGIPDQSELSRLVGPSPRYLSVGHAGLDARCLGAVAAVPGARSAVMVHDTIPLDHPQTQKAGASERFRRKLALVAGAADIVIAPAKATAAEVARHLAAMDGRAETIVARPGVSVSEPGPLPEAVSANRPFFVALGTIEPRKNHALLLDLWRDSGTLSGSPQLVIAGRRGWCSEATFRRLDAMAGDGDVIEFNDLDDRSEWRACLEVGQLLLKHVSNIVLAEELSAILTLEAGSLGENDNRDNEYYVATSLPQISVESSETLSFTAEPTSCISMEKRRSRALAGARAEKGCDALPNWRDHSSILY